MRAFSTQRGDTGMVIGTCLIGTPGLRKKNKCKLKKLLENVHEAVDV